MSSGLSTCVAARAHRLLVWTVGQTDRCSFRGQALWQRPSQRLLNRGLASRGVRGPDRTQARQLSAAALPAAETMDPAVENVVERIHSSTARIVLYLGGGASQAVGWLLSVPGASRTVLDMRIPYSRASLTDVLGAPPQVYACPETAQAMARAAYRQAAKLSSFGTDIVGVGCTCALATDREKRGEHKAYITTYNGSQERSFSLLLAKNARSRLGEDTLVSRLLVKAVAESMGLSAQVGPAGRVGAGPRRAYQNSAAAPPAKPPVASSQTCRELRGRKRGMESDSLGLRRPLPQAAARLRPDMEPCFELSIGNADKGLLPLEEIKRRVSQFTSSGLPLVAPLFTQKADLFHDSVFVVGYDTAVRLVKPDYYGSDQAMLLQFAKLRHQGCSFLVAGRCDEEGRFRTLADLEMPDMLPRGGLFDEIPAADFRADVSSTELRNLGL
ncbi:hypothetical protein CHLNCDRAFT_31015 [Chlorella variabilis]|uniref:Uncharacterized protein n=1 Tax=Chlorella variabilis TaxID=554065 RepID=E1ZEG2_CHLVA|nr:hypothetical protein CHLNCDRAFT_31015 [Chlorella variabilis]EFN55865.1 hypothetical protein CHLNCDRAFT_31015 [Chlorella variabilis]|eukprot:XP_005847967.1 hypothetical protein CHLNCDRAFT_31015 [Chlorella variabilis]